MLDSAPVEEAAEAVAARRIRQHGPSPEGPTTAAPIVDVPRRTDKRTAAAVAYALLQTARPRQWLRNLLVLAAPLAAGKAGNPATMARAGFAAIVFCVAASGTYFFNDSLDADADREHERKCHRPIAAGVLTEREGLIAAGILIGTALVLPLLVGMLELFAVIAGYLACQIAYTTRLKREPVIELMLVASGFVLRFVAGGVAADVPLSRWFLIVTLFGSLVLVTGKRLSEFITLGDRRQAHREVLDVYTPAFLHQALAVCAGVLITGYCLWAFDVAAQRHGSPWYELTILPVVPAVLIYLLIAERGEAGAPEDVLLDNRGLQVLCILWLVLFSVAVRVT
jgi:decaprenyl-phosphate phosphoribosyltransferase